MTGGRRNAVPGQSKATIFWRRVKSLVLFSGWKEIAMTAIFTAYYPLHAHIWSIGITSFLGLENRANVVVSRVGGHHADILREAAATTIGHQDRTLNHGKK
jgi:hypothetical protein